MAAKKKKTCATCSRVADERFLLEAKALFGALDQEESSEAIEKIRKSLIEAYVSGLMDGAEFGR